MEKARVIIEVRGGIVQAVWGGEFLDVLIVDWDNIDDGGECDGWGPPDGSEAAMSEDTRVIVAAADLEI